MPFAPLLMDDQNLYDMNNFVSPWMLTKRDLNPVRPPLAPVNQSFDSFGPEDNQDQEEPPLQLQGQMQSPPPMQNIDLTPSLPSFSGDPRMQQPQFDLGSPHPDVNGETYLPPVSAGSEVGSVTSFDAPRPFSEGFVGAPKAGSTGWDTLGRGVSDALGGAAYNVLTLGGPSSVRTSPNLLMRPGQMSSAELHPGLPDFPDSAPQDFNANLMPLSGGAVLGPQADDSLEGAPQSTIPSANPAPIDGGLVLADEDNNPNDADDLAARPTMAYRDTGDNGVPTFGVSDYVTGSTGAPALDGLNNSDIAAMLAEDKAKGLPDSTNSIQLGSDIPTPPKGMQYTALEPITDKAGVRLGGFNAKFGPEDTSAADAIRLENLRQEGAMNRTAFEAQAAADRQQAMLDHPSAALERNDQARAKAMADMFQSALKAVESDPNSFGMTPDQKSAAAEPLFKKMVEKYNEGLGGNAATSSAAALPPELVARTSALRKAGLSRDEVRTKLLAEFPQYAKLL